MSLTSARGLAYADSEVAILKRLQPGDEHQFVKGGLVCRRVDLRVVEILSAPGIRPSRVIDQLQVEYLS